MDVGSRLLSELVYLRTYAKTLDDGRKESRTETINRVRDMHIRKFPQYAEEITHAFSYVHSGHVVPSMRSMQFAGDAIERANARMYNCAFLNLTSWKCFADLFYLLMCGCGTGYSVQERHVSQLPDVSRGTLVPDVYVIEDSKEGWAQSVELLMRVPNVEFDYSAIRPAGEPLSTGGLSSGPDALRQAHEKIRDVLSRAAGRKLRPIECHDVMCHLADAVVVGGVRRAAMISLFDNDDVEMLTCKSGAWWEENPQRARANNSAVLLRNAPSFEDDLVRVMRACFDSNAGEPGVFVTNDLDWGMNPCAEIALRGSGQLCNLTEINAPMCRTDDEFVAAAVAATVIGTLQASYTDFKFLQPSFKENCEKDALLGVSITGLAQNNVESGALVEATEAMRQINEIWARMLGINPAARIACIKPSGTTSAFLGTTSGIHAAHAPYYLRRVRIDKQDPIAKKLMSEHMVWAPESGQFLEQDKFIESNIIVTLPIAMGNHTIMRDEESALSLLQRVKRIHKLWIQPTHRDGANTHNVSLTVTYKPNERGSIVEWMLRNKDVFAGISFLPFDGGSYTQPPFSEITQAEYEKWLEKIPSDLGLNDINYKGVHDKRNTEAACSGGACEWGQ